MLLLLYSIKIVLHYRVASEILDFCFREKDVASISQ